MNNFEGIVLGAVIALLSSVGLRIWQNERERWVRRVDEFCEILTKASDEAVEFWLEAGKSIEGVPDRKREIRVIGYQTRMDGLLDTFLDKLDKSDQREILERVAAFREAMTGGDFQSLARNPNINRAREVQGAASELFVLARSASDRIMRFRLFGSRSNPPIGIN